MAERRRDFEEHVHPVLARMQERGITRRQAADLLGLSQGYCDQILYRWRRPSVDVMVRMRDIFDVTMDELAEVPIRQPPGARRGRRAA